MRLIGEMGTKQPSFTKKPYISSILSLLKGPKLKFFLILFLGIFTFPFLSFASVDDKIVKIGVLSFRTVEKTMKRWSPTVDSLTAAIPGYTFILLPMNYTEINLAVENKTIDFILTNTGHYIELETNEGINRLVTLAKSINGTRNSEE